MQIKEIILYGINGEIRKVSLNINAVNIISGASKTGKSDIGHIIQYCLCSDSCNISDGVVRDTVAWFALLLTLGDEYLFIARQSPPKGQHSTNQYYFHISKQPNIPSVSELISNTNIDGMKEILSKRLGISENLNMPSTEQTRLPLEANIKHALFYCFQNQGEIASQNFLFHNQHEPFVPQAIKDTLPYFLGIINEEALALEKERSILKRKLMAETKTLKEEEYLQGGGTKRAIELVSEARQVGLIDNISISNTDDNELQQILSALNDWTPINVNVLGNEKLFALQTELVEKEELLDLISEQIADIEKFIGIGTNYSTEADHQKMRLLSIGLFDKLDFDSNHCVLCSAEVEQPLPSSDAIKTAIKNLDEKIHSITREEPKLKESLYNLKTRREDTKNIIKKLRAEIDGLYAQNQETEKIKDINTRRAKVIGRISLWLESIKIDRTDKKDLIRRLEERLNEINLLLDKDIIIDKKQSVLSIISADMSKLAKELELENAEYPFRLDMNKLTVVVDKPERPVPLQELGSGSNWAGIHLITYFALHRYFISHNRPVPQFLFIDQPSQIYFPSEKNKIDLEAVKNLYYFIFKRVEELGMQVIIVDHADLEDFNSAIIERWLGDNKLIPISWYQ